MMNLNKRIVCCSNTTREGTMISLRRSHFTSSGILILGVTVAAALLGWSGTAVGYGLDGYPELPELPDTFSYH